jgi:hypothetical protein
MEFNDFIDKQKRMSHIRNLFALALSDGCFDKNEREFIFKIALRSGLTINELQKILVTPECIVFCTPETEEEKLSQLIDMIKLIMIDNDIDEKEITLCRFFAIKLGYPPEYPELFIQSELNIEAYRKRLINIGEKNKDNPTL